MKKIKTTDIVIDIKSKKEAIVLSISTQEEYLLGFKDGTFGEGLANNICYVVSENKITFKKKPNFEELKQYVAFKHHLLEREIEIFERNEYDNIDILISNLREY